MSAPVAVSTVVVRDSNRVYLADSDGERSLMMPLFRLCEAGASSLAGI